MKLTLVTTHACNLACSYCYAGKKSAKTMPPELGRRALGWAFSQIAPGEEIQVGCFGGEPLLEWDLLKSFQVYSEELAAKRGVKLVGTVTTNGTLLTEDRMAWLDEHKVVVAVSLDGDRAGHDALRRRAGGGSSFDEALRGLRISLARQPLTEAISVIDPGNVRHAANGVKFLLDMGVRVVGHGINYAGAWDEASVSEYERQMEAIADEYVRRFRSGEDIYIAPIDAKVISRLKDGLAPCDKCLFGQGEIAVAPSGNWYPCERMVGEDGPAESRWVLGNARESSDGGPDPVRVLKVSRRHRKPDPMCTACAYSRRCMNFCGCSNLMSGGDVNRPGGVLCATERIALKAADRAAETLFSEGNPTFLRKHYGAQAAELPASGNS